MLNIFDWDERSSTVDIMAGLVTGTGGAMVMAGANGLSETVPRQWVTAGFFDVLGVRAIVGRTFQPSDASPQPTAAVMSEGLWRTRFASDASVIGRQIRFDGIPYTVIGVVPKEFQFLGPRGIWALLPRANVPIWRRQRNLLAIGRLKDGRHHRRRWSGPRVHRGRTGQRISSDKRRPERGARTGHDPW